MNGDGEREDSIGDGVINFEVKWLSSLIRWIEDCKGLMSWSDELASSQISVIVALRYVFDLFEASDLAPYDKLSTDRLEHRLSSSNGSLNESNLIKN